MSHEEVLAEAVRDLAAAVRERARVAELTRKQTVMVDRLYPVVAIVGLGLAALVVLWLQGATGH